MFEVDSEVEVAKDEVDGSTAVELDAPACCRKHILQGEVSIRANLYNNTY